MRYLENRNYYEDLYDLATIKECLGYEKHLLEQKSLKPKIKKSSKKQLVVVWSNLAEFTLYFVKGDRYKNKAESINVWMEKDKKKQERLDNASEPRNVYCPNCIELMVYTTKILEDYPDPQLRVLFFFECPNCKKRKGIYDTGQDYIIKPEPCPKCSFDLKTSYKSKSRILTTTRNCSHCEFTETEVDDLDKSKKEWEKKKEEDLELLSKFRGKYCLSDADGQKYIRWVADLKSIGEIMEKENQKQADPAFQKAAELKKIAVTELEKLLIDVFSKEKYIKLTLEKPEIDRYVVIPFTVQDADPTRKEYDSTNKLQKLLRKALEDTNWRLMSEGTHYRLGYVSGRLKGYEREEDLVELVRKKKEQKEPLIKTNEDYIY